MKLIFMRLSLRGFKLVAESYFLLSSFTTMLTRSLFPGVAVVTGAGGTGMHLNPEAFCTFRIAFADL